ncbi:helix-turn-helix domain-containing protein [Companilactobacillus pabuli]|jgi:transcriptional regulator with XRE-family HTH domain|uniref:helix-turn-helix domain-containing protein n=1 Tax=Companilactobacillus pabuli TaxID=2714036 RepID=UPI003513E06E
MTEIRNARKDIGQRIQEARKAKGLSQDELADKLGSKRTTIGNYERGERSIDTDMIKKIADVLGIPSSLLIDGIPDGYTDRYSIKDLINGDSNYWSQYYHDVTSEDQAEFIYGMEDKANSINTFTLDLIDLYKDDYLSYLQNSVNIIKDKIILKEQRDKINELIKKSNPIPKKELNKIEQYDPFKELANKRKKLEKLNYPVKIKGDFQSEFRELIKNYDNHIPTKRELQNILDKIEDNKKHVRRIINN